MSRIEIQLGDRHVIVDHDGELEPIKQTAMSLFAATGEARPTPGPAFGFSSERRWTPPAQPSGMPCAPGPYPLQGRVGEEGDR